jgi:oxygen-dependent protoporphyrinogen oxidase
VLGAGVAGLAAAVRLRALGCTPTVFEARGRVGGVIQTVRRDGYQVDVGANSMLRKPPLVSEILDQIGLAEEVVVASPEAKARYVVRGGKPVALPSGPKGLLTTSLFSRRARLRAVTEPFRRPASSPDESVAAFVRRRFGAEVADFAVDPFVAGIFAGDPERLAVAHAFPLLTELEREHGSVVRGLVRRAKASQQSGGPSGPPESVSFRGGMETLPRALADAAGPDVRLNTVVRSVRREGSQFVVGTEEGGAVPFDRIVSTIPLHRLPTLDLPLDLDALRTARYAAVTVLALGFWRDDVAHPLGGFGMLVPRRETETRLLGALFSSTLFPGRAPDGHVLLSCFLGGERRPTDASLSEAEQVSLATADLRRLLGVTGTPAFVHRHTWARAIPQYEIGYERVLDRLAGIEEAWPGFRFAGNYRGGISVGAALESGWDAAERVAD